MVNNNEVRIQVGEDVELSEDSARALHNLAESLAAEASGDDVAGFSFGAYSDELFMMMGGGGMGPKISAEPSPDDKIRVGASGGCALDIVVQIPMPKL